MGFWTYLSLQQAFYFFEGLSIYFEFDVEQAKLKAEAGNKGLVCQEKDKQQGRIEVDIYLQTLSHLRCKYVSTHIRFIHDLG